MASTKKKQSTKRTADKANRNETNTPEVVKEIIEAAASEIPNDASVATKHFVKLQRWNKWLSLIFALQGLAILALSDTRLFSITSSFLTPNPLGQEQGMVIGVHHLFDVNMAWLIAVFFFTSAVTHFALATFYRKRYETELAKGASRLSWIDHATGASLMLVVIGILSGIYEFAALSLIFALNATVSLMGLVAESQGKVNKTPNMLAFGTSCVASLVPWLIFALYAFGASLWGNGNLPAFVYWIYGTMFVTFIGLAVNVWMRYQQKGKWADPLFGEKVCMVLVLVAKTLLAWQIFAGLLLP